MQAGQIRNVCLLAISHSQRSLAPRTIITISAKIPAKFSWVFQDSFCPRINHVLANVPSRTLVIRARRTARTMGLLTVFSAYFRPSCR